MALDGEIELHRPEDVRMHNQRRLAHARARPRLALLSVRSIAHLSRLTRKMQIRVMAVLAAAILEWIVKAAGNTPPGRRTAVTIMSKSARAKYACSESNIIVIVAIIIPIPRLPSSCRTPASASVAVCFLRPRGNAPRRRPTSASAPERIPRARRSLKIRQRTYARTCGE
jgi:hypothetical protein